MKPAKMEEGPDVQAATTAASVRTSVTFPSEFYRILKEMAKAKKVSLAWGVRDAAELYVAAKWPLFRDQG